MPDGVLRRFLPWLPRWRVLLRLAVFAAVVVAVGGFGVIWSGAYSVAASRGHWPGFELLLKFAMRSSVRTHALMIEVPPLDGPDRVRRGAAHFQQGCAFCHGSPAGPPMLVVRGTLPEPPDLKALVPTWKANELFWIVLNGLKYTGMPAWPALQREDEVWDVVAFLRELPTLTPERFRELAGFGPEELPASRRPVDRRDADRRDGGQALLASCAHCHGVDGRGGGTTAFPRLDLQTEAYLLDQLEAYAQGRRASGYMQAATAELTPRELAWLAGHYAAGPPPSSPPVTAHDRVSDRSHREGEALFLRGAPEQGLPACESCHGRDAARRDRAYPALLGQHASYTANQLRLYKEGARSATESARLMATIAGRMTDRQMQAVAAYLASETSAPVRR
jgi:cytochrome c553